MELKAAAKKARNDYMKEWRKNNKEKLKGYAETYWEKKVKKEYLPYEQVSGQLNESFAEKLADKLKTTK